MRQPTDFIQYMRSGRAMRRGMGSPALSGESDSQSMASVDRDMAALDSPQDEKLRRVVGGPDELLTVRKGMAKLADSDHRIAGDEQDGSKASQRGPQIGQHCTNFPCRTEPGNSLPPE